VGSGALFYEAFLRMLLEALSLREEEGIVVKRYIVYHRYGQSTILAVSFEEAWRIAREY